MSRSPWHSMGMESFQSNNLSRILAVCWSGVGMAKSLTCCLKIKCLPLSRPEYKQRFMDRRCELEVLENWIGMFFPRGAGIRGVLALWKAQDWHGLVGWGAYPCAIPTIHWMLGWAGYRSLALGVGLPQMHCRRQICRRGDFWWQWLNKRGKSLFGQCSWHTPCQGPLPIPTCWSRCRCNMPSCNRQAL